MKHLLQKQRSAVLSPWIRLSKKATIMLSAKNHLQNQKRTKIVARNRKMHTTNLSANLPKSLHRKKMKKYKTNLTQDYHWDQNLRRWKYQAQKTKLNQNQNQDQNQNRIDSQRAKKRKSHLREKEEGHRLKNQFKNQQANEDKQKKGKGKNRMRNRSTKNAKQNDFDEFLHFIWIFLIDYWWICMIILTKFQCLTSKMSQNSDQWLFIDLQFRSSLL